MNVTFKLWIIGRFEREERGRAGQEGRKEDQLDDRIKSTLADLKILLQGQPW